MLCSPGCPGTHSIDQAGLKIRNPPASASQVLGSKACATTARQNILFLLSVCVHALDLGTWSEAVVNQFLMSVLWRDLALLPGVRQWEQSRFPQQGLGSSGEPEHSPPDSVPKSDSWCRAVVAHAFDPSTWEAEAGGFLSLRPAWSTEWVPGLKNKQTNKQKTNSFCLFWCSLSYIMEGWIKLRDECILGKHP